MRDTDAMVRPADFPRDDLPPLVDPEPAMNPPPTPAWPLVPFQQPGIAPPIFPNPAPQPPPAFIQPIVLTTTYYDRTNPPRRPPDWRRNYVPIGRRFRALSIMCRCEDKISPPLEHCHLTHTLLMPNEKTPVMTLDLRSDLPLLDPERLELLTTTSRRPSNETDLMQRATIQPVDHIRIMHDALPWFIDIHAQSPDNGILVKDILEQTLAALQTPITTSEYYTEVLNADDRERIAEAYRERAGGRVDVLQRGVLRVDYLGKDWDMRVAVRANFLLGFDHRVVVIDDLATRRAARRSAMGLPIRSRFANAIVKGVKGQDFPANKMMTENRIGLPFFAARTLVEKLGVSSWISLACGFWYEWSLVGDGRNRFGIDFERRTVTFFDDGEEITTTTWDQCGRALAGLLSLKRFPDDENDTHPALEKWANKAVYVSSFRVSQKDMFESTKRVTCTSDEDWNFEYVPSDTRFKESVEAFQNGDHSGFTRQMYTRIFYPTGEGDHTRHGLANEALGLPEEDIDQQTTEGLRLLKKGVLSYT
uniref:DUF6699 domain-containing protein n=1 Tax=Mycena chlorophos TaxID=658473 RepID=A0ABQ0L6W0_MYCCL|nr:predicted protein [Mycena chlorophos]